MDELALELLARPWCLEPCKGEVRKEVGGDQLLNWESGGVRGALRDILFIFNQVKYQLSVGRHHCIRFSYSLLPLGSQ